MKENFSSFLPDLGWEFLGERGQEWPRQPTGEYTQDEVAAFAPYDDKFPSL